MDLETNYIEPVSDICLVCKGHISPGDDFADITEDGMTMKSGHQSCLGVKPMFYRSQITMNKEMTFWWTHRN